MKCRLLRSPRRLTGLLAVVLAGPAADVWAQERPVRVFEELQPLGGGVRPIHRALELEGVLEEDSANYALRWQAARYYTRAAAIDQRPEAQMTFGYRGREHARIAIALDSTGVEGHYWHSVASGFLADLEGGRTSVRLAGESWDEAGWVLAVDSLHAGAHHVRGRINAAVQRVGSLLRFLARLLLGADEVGKTSWEAAIHHLERAAELDPGVPCTISSSPSRIGIVTARRTCAGRSRRRSPLAVHPIRRWMSAIESGRGPYSASPVPDARRELLLVW